MNSLRTSTAFLVLALTALATLRGDQMSSPRIRGVHGPAVAVPPAYFGMHAHRLLETTPWPTVKFSNIRLWDTGTTWKDLEPQRNEWRFNKLDRLVSLAEEHRVEVLLCFGKTPLWASSIQPHGQNDKDFETGAPTNLDDWRTFVRTVVNRYKGKIQAYEVWNEASWHGFYQGDVRTMVEMTRIASETIHSIDPKALVVSPSATGTSGLPWFDSFLAQGGGRYVDVIGYHFYVTPEAPEEIPALAANVKSLMQRHNVNSPIWNTETGWSQPKTFPSNDEAAAYVARSLLLAWASGISRFYWYAWDNRNWVTLDLTTGDDCRSTPAASAFRNAEDWMLGQQIHDCSRSDDGTWTCHLTRAGNNSLVIWNPAAKVRFPLPASAGRKPGWTMTDLRGNTQQVLPDYIYADQQPRLLLQ